MFLDWFWYKIFRCVDIFKIICGLKNQLSIQQWRKNSLNLWNQLYFVSFFGSYKIQHSSLLQFIKSCIYNSNSWVDYLMCKKLAKSTGTQRFFCNWWKKYILVAQSNRKEFLEETSSSLSSLKSSLPSQTQEIKAENKPCIEWTGAQTTGAQWSLFSSKSQTFGLGR